LSFAQCHPLLEIRELEQATIGQLAARLGLDKSTLSRTVDDLVRRGLVKRRADRWDRRFMVTTLTAEGRRVCDDINRRNDAFYGNLLGRIPNGKCDDFIALFRQFVEVLGSVVEKRHDPNAGTPPPGDCCPPGDDDLASSTSDGGSHPAATGIPDRDGPE
jgi:DNA-binding MarR family transcriptional regulator